MFSRKFTEKVYNHVQSTYPVPTMQMGSVSAYDISKTLQGHCKVLETPRSHMCS